MLKKEDVEELLRRVETFVGENNPFAEKLDLSGVENFKLLVSILLSSRTRDETTEVVSNRLFSDLKRIEDFVHVDEEYLAELIKPVGFYRVKAKNIKRLAKIIFYEYKGKIPCKREKLLKLPGVGRKTANLFLILYCKKDTICVDTHVHRIANRVGLIKTNTPLDTEKALYKVIPKRRWKDINRLFVIYGKSVCKPVKPKCCECVIKEYCNFYERGGYREV